MERGAPSSGRRSGSGASCSCDGGAVSQPARDHPAAHPLSFAPVYSSCCAHTAPILFSIYFFVNAVRRCNLFCGHNGRHVPSSSSRLRA